MTAKRATAAASVAWRRPAPPSLCAHDTFERADYSDVFSGFAIGAADRTPEQLLRAALDPHRRAVRILTVLAHVVQRRVLGMALDARSRPDHVLGWRIGDGGDDWLRLEASGSLLCAHLVLRRDGGRVEVGTFVRYRTRLGALLWPPVSRLHRQVGLALLRSALRASQTGREGVAAMRVPNSKHLAHPWVMSRIAPDFVLLDAWALPVEGAREDFTELLRVIAALDPARSDSAPTRALFALRDRIGAALHWDDTTRARPIPGSTDTALRDRLPAELRGTAMRPAIAGAHGFVPLYQTEDEWAAEISNATVHGVLQLAWVERGDGRWDGRLGVYVKPRGLLGDAYLKLIAPFRHLVVYPALLAQIGRAWEARQPGERDASGLRRGQGGAGLRGEALHQRRGGKVADRGRSAPGPQ